MAVLVEANSLIIRKDAIVNKMQGGWARFRLLVPNDTLCDDGEVVRVGFLDPREARDFIDVLLELGLVYLDEGAPVDMIMCDQSTGPVMPCNWIEFTHLSIDGGKVGAAWFWEGRRTKHGVCMRPGMTISMPVGWHFKNSLSDQFEYVPRNLIPERRDN